ncbi:hypothetical protein Tco_0749420 [Tanacetum coccineum]|uniref:Uncharacterized protein n=1 Tax=Tanacetum coccineum TaxID=301880 RepID=A0ABQ4YYB9_9ASTR
MMNLLIGTAEPKILKNKVEHFGSNLNLKVGLNVNENGHGINRLSQPCTEKECDTRFMEAVMRTDLACARKLGCKTDPTIGIRASKLDVKETKLHCNVFSRGRVRGVICKLCSSNVDEDTASRLWLQLEQNTVVLRLSISHSNIMQPRATFVNKAHPYSVSFHKGTG